MLNSIPFSNSPSQIPPLLLAYIGDAVYELLVRQYLVQKGPDKVHNIHREAVKYVNAGTQARVLHVLENDLSDEEHGIARKGRNAKSGHLPKNANVAEYRYSTGLESLVGYLYLAGREDRLYEIMDVVCRVVEEEGTE